MIPALAMGLLACARLDITVDIYDGPLIVPPTTAVAMTSAVGGSGLCKVEDHATLIDNEMSRLEAIYVDRYAAARAKAKPSGELLAARDAVAAAAKELDTAKAELAKATTTLETEKKKKASNKKAKRVKKAEDAVEAARAEVETKQTALAAAQSARDDLAKQDDRNNRKKGRTNWSRASDGPEAVIRQDWAAGPAAALGQVCELDTKLVAELAKRGEISLSTKAGDTKRKKAKKLIAQDEIITEYTRLLENAIRNYEGAIDEFVRTSIVAISVSGEPEFADATRLAIEVLRLDADRVSGIAAEGPVNGRVAGFPLFDPYFPQVLRDNYGNCDDDPDCHWTRMSRTSSRASGGNNQFVMVRQGLLVYNQKSLDFDPTPIIGAASASARLGLSLASQLASGATGIPLPTPNEGEGQPAAEATAPTSEAEIDVLRRRITARDEAEREALRELAALLDDLEALDEGDEGGRREIEARINKIIRRFQGRSDSN